jgi:hypothetical protein
VSQRTRRSVNTGHLISVFSGQHASVLTPTVADIVAAVIETVR